MTTTRPSRLRAFWWVAHRWIGIALMLLLVPIGLSGGLLVFHDEIDALVHPSRYAVSGEAVLPPTQLLAGAAAAADNDGQVSGMQVMGVRYPAEVGWPVTVMARQRPAAEGARPRLITLYLDPATGKVLDKVDFRASFFGFLHVFHENLTVPDFSGRQIVGWAGVGMLILSLTGIWLWWPRNGAFVPGLRWRRAPYTTTNLHHLFGFWISIPLAVVSLTGVYLSFPQTARSFMSSVAPMSQQQRPNFAGQIARQTALTADQALQLALASVPEAKPAALFVPVAAGQGNGQGNGQRGGRGGAGSAAGEPAPLLWRVQLRTAEHNTVTVNVDDRRGVAVRQPDPLAGDRAAQWMRWIHEGSRGGHLWQAVVFLTGVLPLVFAVTGTMMWLRGRRNRKAVAAGGRNAEQGVLQAAE
jgi:uncharacterized iron-regulated membrane protein